MSASHERIEAAGSEAAFTLGADGTIEAWTETARRLYGYGAEEVVGRGLEVFYFPEDRAAPLAELLAPAAPEGGRRELVERHRKASGEEIFVALAAAPASGGSVAVTATDVSRRDRAERELAVARSALARSRGEVRRLAGRLLSVREEESRRLGRELHDGLTQRLSALALGLAATARELPPEAAAAAGEIGELRRGVATLADEVRALSHQLHPAAVERRGLAAALAETCSELRRSAGLDVDLRLDEDLEPLPEDVALALYRIAQEGLANVVRHAGVGEARLVLERRSDAVALTLADAGAGFDPAARAAGLGLVGMEERARLLDGSLRIESSPGLGTEIEVIVPVDEAPGEVSAEGAAVAPARYLGPYRLLRVLGKGATATVYLAEEPEPLGRQVALKLQRAPLSGYREALRFKAEHRALARLHHPNVAQVYEAHTTEDGDPYLIMEYVPGLEITAYCDRYRLGLDERLKLFAAVCRGVLHAHQKGILHRDLKPSNILVTEDDGRPVPKIVDFGIAKGLDAPLAEGTVWTREPAGSPAYMSPEAFAGGEVDTRSDVYSLGVLLYELLTGSLPPPAGSLPGTPGDARGPGPVPRPSRRLRALDPDTAARVADDRRSQPAALARDLALDLDWVVLKALAREPAERYAGAAELAEEVSRTLRREPVAAGPPSSLYRLRKLARRYRGVVASVLLVTLALAGGLVATIFQAQRAGREAARAEREAAAAEQVAGFLAGLFEASDPAAARGGVLSARQLLDRGAERVERELGRQPLIQARLMDTIGEIYSELGLYEPARPLLERALELRTALLGEEHLEVAVSLQHLADLYQRSGGEAEPLYRRALAIREGTLGPGDPLVADVLSNLAVLHARQGRFDDAGELFERALAIREQALGPDHTDVAKILNNLAGVYQFTGRLEEAEPLQLRALEIRERVLEDDHPDLAASLTALAAVYGVQGRWQEAVPLLRRAVEVLEKAVGPDHPRVATSIDGLANGYRALGDADAAERAYRRALAIREQAQGPDHPDVAYPLYHLASLYLEQGRLAEAEPFYRRARLLAEQALEPDHPLRVSTSKDLAALLRQTGREAEAAALEARAAAAGAGE